MMVMLKWKQDVRHKTAAAKWLQAFAGDKRKRRKKNHYNLQVRSEEISDWLRLLSWLNDWFVPMDETLVVAVVLLLVVEGFKDKFNGASALLSLALLLTVVWLVCEADPFVECAGNCINSIWSIISRVE